MRFIAREAMVRRGKRYHLPPMLSNAGEGPENDLLSNGYPLFPERFRAQLQWVAPALDWPSPYLVSLLDIVPRT